jgi:hypothetical protein
MKPWGKGCKVYQAGNLCHTYEVSDEGNYIASCDISMKWNDCLVSNKKPHVCLEFCPDFNCIREEFGKYLTVSFWSTLAVLYISIGT